MHRLSYFLVLLTPWAAFAANPHFVGQTKATLEGATVEVSFKEAGLGQNVFIDYVASASSTALYACQNGGGNFPSDPKKQEDTGLVTAEGTFGSGKNGNITASLTLAPPASTLECPPGQQEVLVSVSYTGIQIEDLTNGVTDAATPSSLAVTYYEL